MGAAFREIEAIQPHLRERDSIKCVAVIHSEKTKYNDRTDYQNSLTAQRQQLASSEDPTLDEKLQVEGMSTLIIDSLIAAGYDTPRKVLTASAQDLAKNPEISLDMAYKILEEVRKSKLVNG